MIAGVIIAGVCAIRVIILPDPHTFVHGVTLHIDERLELVDSAKIIRADGFPDLERIKDLLCEH